MATGSAIARPYAQAAYEFAQAKKELPLWGAMLRTAAIAIEEPAVYSLLANDRILPKQWFSVLSELLKPYLSAERINFLRLVTDNKRVSAFPEIANLFKEYEELNNQVSEVEVTTAMVIDAKQQQKLTDKLSKLLNIQVSLRCVVDENILGGALVRVGDKVIDGSVRGQLARLLEFAIR